MGVHENVELILFRDAKDIDGEIKPFLVVDTRSRMFNGFPGKDTMNGIIAPIS
jgi:hypothetical protein